MKKERRDFVDCRVIDLTNSTSALHEEIGEKTDGLSDEGVVYREYRVLPKFGVGSIISFEMESIDIIINRFKLKKNLVVYNGGNTDYVLLSFLLEGEKIISFDDSDTDILYENQESYLVNINSFKGYSIISGGKLFKEIKIRLSQAFLTMHGFTNNTILQNISDKNIIVPITADLFTVLSDLENKNLKGITKKIYLKAKVFELLAMQIENCKNANVTHLQGGKIIKKLYQVRQLIKNNLHKSFTTKQLAVEMTLNEHVLKREFKRIFGCSIAEFSTNEKMERAQDLLKNPQLPIYQIADEIGYKNATHFTVAFKRYFGMTPKYARNSI